MKIRSNRVQVNFVLPNLVKKKKPLNVVFGITLAIYLSTPPTILHVSQAIKLVQVIISGGLN